MCVCVIESEKCLKFIVKFCVLSVFLFISKTTTQKLCTFTNVNKFHKSFFAEFPSDFSIVNRVWVYIHIYKMGTYVCLCVRYIHFDIGFKWLRARVSVYVFAYVSMRHGYWISLYCGDDQITSYKLGEFTDSM